MLENGYTKILRSIVNWRWYKDENTFRVFLHLFFTANYEPQDWRGITIKRGQRAASYETIALELGLTVRKVRTAVKHLKSTGEVTHEKTAVCSLFTVNNYDEVQGMTSNVTDERHASDTQVTDERQQWNKDNKSKESKESNNTTPRARVSKRTNPKPAPPKTQYAEFVSMTNAEYTALVTKLGEQGAARCIEVLDNYKGASGKTYASDYRAILSWVIKRVDEERARAQTPHGAAPSNGGRAETVNERNNRLLDGFFGSDESNDRPRIEAVIEHDFDEL